MIPTVRMIFYKFMTAQIKLEYSSVLHYFSFRYSSCYSFQSHWALLRISSSVDALRLQLVRDHASLANQRAAGEKSTPLTQRCRGGTTDDNNPIIFPVVNGRLFNFEFILFIFLIGSFSTLSFYNTRQKWKPLNNHNVWIYIMRKKNLLEAGLTLQDF